MKEDSRNRILEAMRQDRANFAGSDSKYAASLGINNSVYSRLQKGETDRVLSDAAWYSIARRLQVELNASMTWVTARTPVFEFITTQLEACQSLQMGGMLVDIPDIGKTYTARAYVRTHANAKYIDCSLCKTKQKLVRTISKEFGLGSTGKYSDVFEDLIYYLKSSDNPLIILDEAGDLQYEAFLELKALWNATERACGWYMMGADGLRRKVERAIDNKKVGYAEIFSRFGSKYNRITPVSTVELESFRSHQSAAVIQVNDPSANIKEMLARTGGSLRRVYIEVKKSKSN
jgi:hypothetical protein